jgi:hypothetical protein
MPLARYFLLVGAALLVVLLIAGACLPPLPAVERAETQRTAIRIHSNMKLPERVIFDTSMPTVTHHVGPVIADAGTPAQPSANDVSTKAREAFAQLQSSDASKVKIAEPKRPEFKPPRKSETRKRAAASRQFRVARQPQFDWFGGRMWW